MWYCLYMEKKNKLTRAERFEIGILLHKEYSFREIARALERSPNTISYEVAHNCVNGIYDPIKAHRKALVKRKYRRHQWSKIETNEALEHYIIQKLRHGWNPREVSGRMRKDKEPFSVSKTTIYIWLRGIYGERYQYLLPSQKLRSGRRKKKKTKREMVPHRIPIFMRNNGATNRSRYGHWEVDTMLKH